MKDLEFRAMAAIMRAFDSLDEAGKKRVLHYILERVDPMKPGNGAADEDDDRLGAEH
jgi:hypothetical protein